MTANNNDLSDNPISPLHPANLNPLFHVVLSASVVPRLEAGDSFEDVYSWLNVAHRGMAPDLMDILEREPDPRNAKSKSPFVKYMLGSFTKYIEVWAMPSGQKMIMITNGTKKEGKRKLYKVIPVRKIQGVWLEYKETIQP